MICRRHAAVGGIQVREMLSWRRGGAFFRSPLSRRSSTNFFDYKHLKTHAVELARNAAARKAPCDATRVAALVDARAQLTQEVDALRAQRNAYAASSTCGSREAARALKAALAEREGALAAACAALDAAAAALPNGTHPAAPVGDESAAKLLGTVGEKREFLAFPPRDHVALGEALGLWDFGAAARAAGAGFVTLKGAGVALELALVQWAVSRLRGWGFSVLAPPDVALAPLVEGCGFAPRDGAGSASQVYAVEGSPLCLVGTSEIPLAAQFSGSLLPPAAVAGSPLLHGAWGHCFRREAGGAGAATRGLYRLHQFTKVEMFAHVAGAVPLPPALEAAPFKFPHLAAALRQWEAAGGGGGGGGAPAAPPCAASEAVFARLVDAQASLLAELGLHARVLDMPTEELGAPAFRKVDMEVWMPGRGAWGEVSSASNCTDYQARRLGLRYRWPTANSPPAFFHTLNATAAAVPRLLLALVETHQTEAGAVRVPECLVPFMGGARLLEPPAATAPPPFGCG
jgi:seryl-tRNA synthetase